MADSVNSNNNNNNENESDDGEPCRKREASRFSLFPTPTPTSSLQSTLWGWLDKMWKLLKALRDCLHRYVPGSTDLGAVSVVVVVAFGGGWKVRRRQWRLLLHVL
ncbi:hypothetical protein ACLKA6_010831 [Drosophila palustris]